MCHITAVHLVDTVLGTSSLEDLRIELILNEPIEVALHEVKVRLLSLPPLSLEASDIIARLLELVQLFLAFLLLLGAPLGPANLELKLNKLVLRLRHGHALQLVVATLAAAVAANAIVDDSPGDDPDESNIARQQTELHDTDLNVEAELERCDLVFVMLARPLEVAQ